MLFRSITSSALATSILPRPQVLESFRRPSILQALDLPAFKMSTILEDRPPLPAIGHDLSRPSSAASTVASYTQQRHGSHASIQLPALSTLASVASSSPPASKDNKESKESNGTASGMSPPTMPLPSPPASRYVVQVVGVGVGVVLQLSCTGGGDRKSTR